MTGFLIVMLGILSAGGCAAGMYVLLSKRGVGTDSGVVVLEGYRDERQALLQQIKEAYERLVPVPALRAALKDLAAKQEALRAEKGRITITQAELETVENRLRELEEVERELEASGLETKEELNILKKKEGELAQKNDNLKKQIEVSTSKMDQIVTEIEMSEQLKEQITACKTELLQTEQSVATLILQIEQGNEQYFVLKRRYDALDIEYAQLFEKFSEAEALVGEKGNKES